MKGKKILKERKRDLILLGSSLVALLVLVVLLFNLNTFFGTPEMDNLENPDAITGGNTQNQTNDGNEELDTNEGEYNEKQECMVDLGVNPDSVIFYHSDTCPHCITMKPRIEELEDTGYDFYWAEGSDRDASQVVGECFGDMVEGYVPLFICPSNLETNVGAMSEEDLKAFADRC